MHTATKAPAFQWYPKDILTSQRVALMSLAEEGAYRRALDFCWLNGTLPADTKKLAMIIGKGCTAKIAATVKNMFIEQGETLIHERLEEERAKQKKHREESSERGKGGGNPHFTKGKTNPYYTKKDNLEDNLADNLKDNLQDNVEDMSKINSSSASSFSSSFSSSNIVDDDDAHTFFKNWFDNLNMDKHSIENLADVYKCHADTVLEALEEFKQKKVATGETAAWQSETDMRKHFNNWLPSFIQRKNNPPHIPFKKKHRNQPDPDKIGVNSRAEVTRRLQELLGTDVKPGTPFTAWYTDKPQPEPKINRVTQSAYEASTAEIERYFANEPTGTFYNSNPSREPRINRVTKSHYDVNNAELEAYFSKKESD